MGFIHTLGVYINKMGTSEDGDAETGRDWLANRQGLDRDALEAATAEREQETDVKPGLLVRLSVVRRAASTPLRLVSRGVRRALPRLERDTEESDDGATPIADGTESTVGGDHHVGTRTGRPKPATDGSGGDRPVIEDAAEFNWGDDRGTGPRERTE